MYIRVLYTIIYQSDDSALSVSDTDQPLRFCVVEVVEEHISGTFDGALILGRLNRSRERGGRQFARLRYKEKWGQPKSAEIRTWSGLTYGACLPPIISSRLDFAGTTKPDIYTKPMTPPFFPSFTRARLLKPLAAPPAGIPP